MKIIKEGDDKYALIRVTPKYNAIVRILKKYEEPNQAIDDMTKLLVGEITECDLLSSSFEHDVELGKLGNRILVLEAALNKIRSILKQSVDGNGLEEAARQAIEYINEILDD